MALTAIALVIVAVLRLGNVEWQHIGLLVAFIPMTVVAVRHGQKHLLDALKALRHQATHDSLTGLPNRALFEERLQASMRRKTHTRRFALALLDLDGFKLINDRHGHLAGDTLLKAVAERLLAGVRSNDTVARFGGDEFVLILESVTNASVLLERCEQLRIALAQPHRFIGRNGHVCVQVNASIGIALGTNLDADQLIQKADQALYQAKADGKNSCVLSS